MPMESFTSDQKLDAFFGGHLDEQDIVKLYQSASIQVLSDNQQAILKSDKFPAVYIVAGRNIQVMKSDRPADAFHFEGPSVILPAGFQVQVSSPGTVIQLPLIGLDTLSEKSRRFFWEKIHQFSAQVIEKCLNECETISGQNIRLQDVLLDRQIRHYSDYERQEFVQDILGKIPRLPAFVYDLTEKLLDDGVSHTEIVSRVQQDPSMAANILKVVNSPLYGFSQKIQDINQAVMLLGLNELHNILVAIGFRMTMPDLPQFLELYAHSTAISRIVLAIALETRAGHPAQLRTIGLLHDVGQSVVLLLKKQNSRLTMLIDSLDSAQLGGLLLAKWKLPPVICDTVRFQFYPDFSTPENIPPNLRQNVAILYLAHLCYENMMGKKNPDLVFLPAYKALLNLPKMSLDELIEKGIVPKLKKEMHIFPAFFRKILRSCGTGQFERFRRLTQ